MSARQDIGAAHRRAATASPSRTPVLDPAPALHPAPEPVRAENHRKEPQP
ncbi:hypothetical protein ABZ729_00095 [Streptomyces sp. NPDC006678]